ncbi:MAG: diacylglycerol/lipid kinase family protein [Flavobacteriales bacterium]
MRVHFIVHGGRKAAWRAEAYLIAHQTARDVFEFTRTTGSDHAETIAQVVRHNAELLVVIGGDGLFSLCVKSLLRNPGTMPVLALIPSGSGNDFARNFGWKKSASDFLERLARRETKWIDTGKISNASEVDHFTNETSAGISHAVVRFVYQKPTSWNGNFKFGISILQAFLTFRKNEYIIRWEEGTWKGRALLVACCNGRFFGSGIGIAPEAMADDGILELVIIGNVNVIHYLRFLPKLRRSEKIAHPQVHYFKAKQIEIRSSGSLERDGEPGMSLPALIVIQPKAIEVLM